MISVALLRRSPSILSVHSIHSIKLNNKTQDLFIPAWFSRRRYQHDTTTTRNHRRIRKWHNAQKEPKQFNKRSETTEQEEYVLFASTLPGLENVLSHELDSKIRIKKKNQRIVNGGVGFEVSTIRDLYKCHLLLGTASHIYLRANGASSTSQDSKEDQEEIPKRSSRGKGIDKRKNTTSFFAIHEKQLVQKVRRMTIWKKLISVSNSKDVPIIDVRVSTTKSKLHHTKMIADLVRKGIHQSLDLGNNHTMALNDAFNKCFNKNGPTIRVLVRIHFDEVEISIDTSRIPLHKRGYKLDVRKAPLREDIAYALLYAAGWNCSANFSQPYLIDPFCGSGTILIEGASMILNLPPGRLRPPPCQYTSLYNEILWNDLVQQNMNAAKSKLDEYSMRNSHHPFIVGGDRDDGAIEAAMANAKRAGVSELIQLEKCAAKANRWLNPNTILNSIDQQRP